MTAPLTDVYVVSHTHWDREWYHTAERFRQRLVRLVDELLDDPPPADAGFLLDGQAIVLEDYLAVRPERHGALAGLIRDGRVEAGPWYVLADELIPSGEALVRNLLAGTEQVRRIRASAAAGDDKGSAESRVLYCPDSFGHPAALPDLAAGFGCDVILLWRGFGGQRWPAADVVRWRGSGGASVLVYHLPPDGYEFGSSLPVSPAHASLRWERVRDALAPRAVTGAAILLNGADHHARQRDLAGSFAALRDAALPVRVHAASMSAAAHRLVDAAAHVAAPEVVGELRDSYGYTWTLQGTLATRAHQKRRNAIAERRLVRDVEPWVALSSLGGDAASRALLDAAWRTLLQAHPHDTLCGTSIDAVADAFDARMSSAEAQGRGLRDDALLDVIGHDPERARSDPASWRPTVVVRNRAARPRAGVIELHLSATIADVAVGPGSGSRQGARRPLPPWRVDGIPLQILSRREAVALTESARSYPDADRVAEVRVVGWVGPVGGYSIETRPHLRSALPPVPNPVVAEAHSLDNGRIRIDVDDEGHVAMTDRLLGRRITNMVSIEDAVDAGDLYTPAIRASLPIAPPARVRLVHRGPLRGELAIEYRFGRGGFCRVSIQLDADSRAMRVLVSGRNAKADHRLRIRFDTGLPAASTVADAAFLPVARSALTVGAADASMEHVVPTAPLHRWVARFAPDAGVALVSDGLAEYESAADGALFVTLVRAVGELSRADLVERPGHAGWPVPTPAAQCLCPYEARFALTLVGGDSPSVRDEIQSFAEDMLLPLTGATLRSNLGGPVRSGGLELRGEGLVFSAAMPARREGWIVLRCVNQRDAPAKGEWELARAVSEARRARLDETPGDTVPFEGNIVRFDAHAHEIVTILVR